MKKVLALLALSVIASAQTTQTTTIRLSETKPVNVTEISILVLDPTGGTTKLVPFKLGPGIVIDQANRTLRGVNQAAWFYRDSVEITTPVTTLTLTKDPALEVEATVNIYHNGKYMTYGPDFTVVGRIVTLKFPVEAGDRITAAYLGRGIQQ